MSSRFIVLVAAVTAATRASVHLAQSWRVARRASGRLEATPAPSRTRLAPWLAKRIDDAALGITAEGFATLWAGAVLVGLCSLPVMGAAGLLVVALAVGGPVLLLNLRQGADRLRQRRSLPVLLDATAAALRSGVSLPSALVGASATVGGRLGEAVSLRCRRIERGETVGDAFADWPARPTQITGWWARSSLSSRRTAAAPPMPATAPPR